MKIFNGREIFKRIALILLVVVVFSLINPFNNVQARSWLEDTLGDLLEAIMQFLMMVADAIMDLLQKNFISMDDAIIRAESSDFSEVNFTTVLGIFLGVVVAVVGIIVAIPTGGSSAVAGIAGAAAIVKGVCVGTAIAAVGTAVAVTSTNRFVSELKGEFDIPMFAYTPYSIFSGQIPALDINFINPMKDVHRAYDVTGFTERNIEPDEFVQAFLNDEFYVPGEDSKPFGEWLLDELFDPTNIGEEEEYKQAAHYYEDSTYYIIDDYHIEELDNGDGFITTKEEHYLTAWSYNGIVYALDKIKENPSFVGAVCAQDHTWTPDEYSFKLYVVSVEKLRLGGIDFFTLEENFYHSSAGILQDTLATWYKVFRRIAMVFLLSILVYVGIRIILSAAADKKAKYKRMFMDWLVALCLLFILQYIMVLVLTLSSSLTKIFVKNGAQNIILDLPENTKINSVRSIMSYKDMTEEAQNKWIEKQISEGKMTEQDVQRIEVGEEQYPKWMGDFVGYVRLIAGVSDNWTAVAYGLMYLVLVIYTCTFTIMYIKRVLFMAFLTMIAPLIAVTYPLDKMNDGQAQAFGLWTREYIFNALIQPLHLIIYTMTISTVMNLAIDYPVYALVALGFITPAEQFLRKMFGFEKAGTISTLGAMAGGAAVYSGIQKLSGLGKMKKHKDEDKDDKPVRTADKKGIKMPKPIAGKSSGIKKAADGVKKKAANKTRKIKTLKNKATRARRNLTNKVKENVQTAKKSGTEATKKKGKIKKAMKKVGHGMAGGIRYVGARQLRKIQKAKPLRGAGRIVGKVAGAATLGTAGLAAGIASGDASKAFTYTAGGGAAGSALGGTLADNAMGFAGETKESFQKGYEGEQAYNNRKADERDYASDEYQSLLHNNNIRPDLKGRQRTKAIREEVDQYRSSGITDWGTIQKAMSTGMSTQNAVWTIKLAEAIGRDGWNNQATKAAFKAKWDASLGNSANDIWNNIELFL